MPEERKAFPLRLSRDLFDEVQRMAAEELRSVNGQIEYLLREAIRRRGRLSRQSGDDRSAGDPAE